MTLGTIDVETGIWQDVKFVNYVGIYNDYE